VAFLLGRDLPPRGTPYTEQEIRSAIGAAHLVIELIGARYADPASVSFPELLADNVANAGLFVGPAIADPFTRPLEQFPLVVRTPAGPLHTREGKHPDGHPLLPLYWLANYLATRGDFLRAGQIVTTGSYAGVLEVPLATPLTFAYGDFPGFTVTFAAS
jgi:2-keto-4-pentenoate hydratase